MHTKKCDKIFQSTQHIGWHLAENTVNDPTFLSFFAFLGFSLGFEIFQKSNKFLSKGKLIKLFAFKSVYLKITVAVCWVLTLLIGCLDFMKF